MKLCYFIFLSFCSSLCCQSAMKVSHLPGFNGQLPFHLETGYISIIEENEAELFYYFVESERKPEKDPLILWLTGGPGCSGFVGLALHMGPLHFKIDDFDGISPTIVTNPYSWTKIANIIFMDWPASIGFSYSKNDKGCFSEDFHAMKQIHSFLKKWLLNHPKFISNPFYMGGESYGGKLATLVAHEIIEGNEQGQNPIINFKGYLIGNAITGEITDKNSQVLHAYGLGVIPEELFKLIEENCIGEDYQKSKRANCKTHLQDFKKFISEINPFSIMDPICSDEPPNNADEFLKLRRSLMEKSDSINCITPDLLANYWANTHLARKALHVREGTVGRWHRCNFSYSTQVYNRSIPTSVPYHRSLTTRGFRALIYSGDHDLQVPFVGSLKWIKSLRFLVLDPWRSWHAGGQVAGYMMSFANNMTFATIKGGGHLAPTKRPMQSYVMFERWISQQVL